MKHNRLSNIIVHDISAMQIACSQDGSSDVSPLCSTEQRNMRWCFPLVTVEEAINGKVEVRVSVEGLYSIFQAK